MNRLERMLDTHPEPAGSNGDQARRCIEACAECAQTCTVCADACLAEDDVQRSSPASASTSTAPRSAR
jgi:hypothetical protein